MNQPTNLGELLRRRLNQPKEPTPDPTIRFVDILRMARQLHDCSLLTVKEWFEAYADITGKKKYGDWTILEAGVAIKGFLTYMTMPPVPLTEGEILDLEAKANDQYIRNGQLTPYSVVLTRLVEKAHNITEIF